MKKIIVGFLLLFAVNAKLLAQEKETTTTTTYWYYPSQNVYYNEATGDYWYYDQPTVKWVTTKTLPGTYVITDADTRYSVKYPGIDVWKENKAHKMKYKPNKGKTKVKGK